MASSGCHRTRGRYQRHELAAAAAGAVLVVVIAVMSAWAHHSLSTSRPTASNAAKALPAATASAAPVGSPSLHAQLRAWLEPAGPSIDALMLAADDLVATANRGDVAATGVACQKAAAALASAQQHLPSPDPALNTALQQAFDGYQAGIRCGVAGQVAGLIDQGKISLQKAFDILQAGLSPDSDVLTV